MSFAPGTGNGDHGGSVPPMGAGTLPRSGLPPVAPPTAGFLVRLFLVPAVIVAVGVGAAFLFHLSFGWLLGSPSTPEQFLAKLDDSNPEVRWRAAADLSPVLLRDNRFASDADFAQELVKRLQKAREETKAAEAELAKRFPPLSPEEIDKLGDEAWLKREKELERENTKLDGQRTYIQFLTACLGNFMVPVGVPALRDLAVQDTGVEADQLADQRRRAVTALAVLGENCKRFDKLTPIEQKIVLDKLEDALTDPERADNAREVLTYLRKRQENLPDAMGVDLAMEKCAQADDPFLRELTAFALNFWTGNDAANQRMEATLDRLAHDDGHGTQTVDQLRASARRNNLKRDMITTIAFSQRPAITTIAYSQPPELNVRLNATIALARRGSDKVHTGRLAEMLDENKLRSQFLRENITTEKSEPDEGVVVQTIMNALNAVDELHKKRPEKITSAIRTAVHNLKGNANAAIRNQAEETAQKIGSGQ
jgi:hypothetical protein